MSEITKLYENAGLEPVLFFDCESYNQKVEKGYLFTAEKQLELIKWLARKGLIQINYSSHQCYQFNSFRVGGDYKTDISEALASHCNNIWQTLTEQDRTEIADILRG